MSRTISTAPSRLLRCWPLGIAAGVALALAPAAARAQQVPETHTVKSGDTLWDIAKQYLKDPFLWPEIYRLNTLVVEDPHWIYPGEVLRLAPSEKATAVPQADTTQPVAEAPEQPRPGIAEVPDTITAAQPAPSEAEAESEDTTGLFPPARGRARLTLTAGELPPKSPLRSWDFHSAGFLTEGEEMPFGRMVGPVIPPQIPTRDPRGAATLYTTIAVTPPAGASYQVGDTLLVVNTSAMLQGYGRIVEPRGLARVVSESEGIPIAEVIAVYGEILPDQAVLPAEKFPDPGPVRPEPVSDGLQAAVIGWPGRRELKGSGIVLFIDKGRSDGVGLGDMFEIRRAAGRHRDGAVTIADVMATAQVVHVREHTATVRIVGVSSPDVPRGTHAFQVAKLPS